MWIKQRQKGPSGPLWRRPIQVTRSELSFVRRTNFKVWATLSYRKRKGARICKQQSSQPFTLLSSSLSRSLHLPSLTSSANVVVYYITLVSQDLTASTPQIPPLTAFVLRQTNYIRQWAA